LVLQGLSTTAVLALLVGHASHGKTHFKGRMRGLRQRKKALMIGKRPVEIESQKA
jgi:hypothetical protein